MHGRFILQGIAVSTMGAFIWIMLYLHSIYQGRDRVLVVLISGLLGLLMASFYLIPVGVLIGLAIPPLAQRKSAGFCLVAGVLWGIGIAGVTSVLVAIGLKFNLRSSFLSMCPICSLFITGWMLKLRKAPPPAVASEPMAPESSPQSLPGSEAAKS